MEYIDLTPTTEGYRNIAHRLAAQILSDIRKARTEDDRAILDSLIEIVAYLAVTEPGQIKALRAAISSEPIHSPLLRDIR
jgi:hypothetical protein